MSYDLRKYDQIYPILEEQRNKGLIIRPSEEHILRVFNDTPYERVKVVILGQDPYPNFQAIGRAFDNLTKYNPSPSLVNIFRELYTDVGTSMNKRQESYLEHWTEQGVLLLNTALSVIDGKPGSHTELWKDFTLDVIKSLNHKKYIVWILWGNHAKSFESKISPTHGVLTGAHPSPLAGGKFFGGGYFSKCNELLEGRNLAPINW